MKLLLDTHILIWFLEGNPKLRPGWIDIIADLHNTIYFSSVSIAEMAIKASKNKLTYPENIVDICLNQGLTELNLTGSHCLLLKDLPLLHNDPFDRLLIVQSMVENLHLMSEDKIFKEYKVSLVI